MRPQAHSFTSVGILLFFFSSFAIARLGDEEIVWEPYGTQIKVNTLGTFGCFAAINIRANVIVTVPSGTSTVKVFQQEDDGSWNQLGNSITQRASELALSADGRTVILGDGGTPGGIVKVFSLSENNGWLQMGATIIGNSTVVTSDGTGSSIGISNDGKTIAVGSPGYNNRCGKVEIYDFGTEWKRRGDAIDCWGNAQRVGLKLSLSGMGDKVLIWDRVYHWVSSSASWEQLGTDLTNQPPNNILRGIISNDGMVVALAFPYSDGKSEGMVVDTYSLNEEEAEWEQLGNAIVQEIPGPKLTYMALNAQGNTLLVNWPYGSTEYEGGLARVFELAVDEWKQIGQTFTAQPPYMSGAFNVGVNYAGDKIFLSFQNKTDTTQENLFQVYAKSS